MPAGTAVASVERKLKKRYPGNDRAVYGTLNKAGLMKGNKVTRKGMLPARKKRQSTHALTPGDGY